MTVDVAAARDFMAAHARVLDRRRFELLLGEAEPSDVVAALDAYRNADGGYGWGLEADLRAPESQPGAALHAFEVFEEIAPATAPEAAALCDWLQSVSLPDGGLPFVLPIAMKAASAPWWTRADPTVSSLQITSIVAANAHRVAAHDRAVADHPWLERATEYCLAAIAELREQPFAYVLGFSVHFLDALHDTRPQEAESLLRQLREFVPDDGRVAVTGGAEDEALRPLDLAPYPDRPARTLFSDDVMAADLDRLESEQQEDGGWVVDFKSVSPAAALEWRGYATVNAVDILSRNGRLAAAPAGVPPRTPAERAGRPRPRRRRTPLR